MKQILEYAIVIMSSETQLLIKSVVGIIAGLLIALGILPDSSKDLFVIDASTVAGYIIAIISTVYLLEPALQKMLKDLHVSPPPSTTVTQNTTVETPAPSVNG